MGIDSHKVSIRSAETGSGARHKGNGISGIPMLWTPLRPRQRRTYWWSFIGREYVSRILLLSDNRGTRVRGKNRLYVASLFGKYWRIGQEILKCSSYTATTRYANDVRAYAALFEHDALDVTGNHSCCSCVRDGMWRLRSRWRLCCSRGFLMGRSLAYTVVASTSRSIVV